MLKTTTKIATLAVAGTLLAGGGAVALQTHAESAYNATAVAGITLSVNDYVSTIEDTAPAVSADASADAAKKDSGKYSKLVMANVENALNVRKKADTTSEIVGQMYKGDAGKVVKKKKNWTKIKSGNVTGWVKNEFLLFGDEAHDYAKKVCNKTATVKTTTLNVREKKSKKSDILTQVAQDCEYTVKKVDDDWVKIVVDDSCKGYVSKDYVDVDIKYGKALTMQEIQDIQDANEAAEAQDQANAAAAADQTTTTTETQTVTSTTTDSVSTIKPQKKSTISSASSGNTSSSGSSFSGSSSSSSSTSSSGGSGSSIAAYASQFVGNPYVYGGSSLTRGADCSGFTMSVFSHFGYSLPHNAAAQAGCGTQVSMSDLQPGDLIFYHGYGHVAIYIGGGSVVHASNPSSGIKISAYNYSTPNKAVRIAR